LGADFRMNRSGPSGHPRYVNAEPRPPDRDVVLYDGQCGFCSRWAKYWSGTLERRGFGIASLDEPWVAEKLRIPHEELVTDIRLLATDGQLISGADVYLYVARRIWWAWPFYAIFSLPGFNRLIRAGYKWFAGNRYCVSHACKLQPRG
jgi:predicted DCC family thiol-disulfide oxidoreductase YuxK